MTGLEKIHFFGGLNSDDDDRVLPDGDYRYAVNIRNSLTDQASGGSIENTRGNKQVEFTLPNGLNKGIGGVYDAVNERIIFFIYNTLGNHSIYEFDIPTSTVTLLLQSPVFNFYKDYPILHIDIIDDLCYWTDKKNPPRKINIARAKAGEYTIIDEQSISRIQYAPTNSPTTIYGSDASVKYNRVRGKMFQFKYAFVYKDNEISAFSPVSKIAIPPQQSLYDFDGYYEPSIDNFIAVTVDTGNYLCKRIQILSREDNNSAWVLTKELDKNELNIQNNSTHTFNFFNDSVYIPVEQEVVNRPYDYVPLVVAAQSIVDGNRIVDSNITEGYDNIQVNATAVPVYNEAPPEITSRVTTGNSIIDTITNNQTKSSAVSLTEVMSGSGTRVSDHIQFIRIINNTVNTTDVWSLSCYMEAVTSTSPGTLLESARDVFTKTFPAGTDSLTIANYFVNAINNSTAFSNTAQSIASPPYAAFYAEAVAFIVSTSTTETTIAIHYQAQVTFGSSGFADATAYYRTQMQISSNVVKKTFKKNSLYSFALSYHDHANRSGVCQITDAFDVKILSTASLINRGHVEMDITIYHTPPSWSKACQLLVTNNRTYEKYLQTDINGWTSTGPEYKVYVDTILAYNTMSGDRASLSYSWTKGDRLTILTDGSDNFLGEFLDFEILGEDVDGSGRYLRIPNNQPLNFTVGNLIEIYTPSLNQDQVLYWEIGEVYPIINGYHTGNTQNQTSSLPAIIRVSSGDAYYRYRGYNINQFVEDANLSDWYKSDSWDKGRFNVVDKDYKQINRYATSFYSQPYVPETNINGLSTVFETNFNEANKNYGAIQRTHPEMDRIYFFQEIRTGYSLVDKSILYNADGTPQGTVGQASQVLSSVQYYGYDGGIGDNPESFTFSGFQKYHVDGVSGVALRLSVDGYTEISGYKQRVFFRDMFNARKKIPKAFRGKVWGVYDVASDEYILFFDKCAKPDSYDMGKEGPRITPGEILIPADAIAFSEEKNRWTTHYSYNPEFILNNGIGLISFNEGSLWLHNEGDLYNNFFNKQWNSSILPIAKDNPSAVKFYSSMFEESTDVWKAEISTPEGQESDLDYTDFELNEGVYYAAFLKDKNTPNISIPLIEGDDLRSTSLRINLVNENTEFVKLFAINVRYGISEMTNK